MTEAVHSQDASRVDEAIGLLKSEEWHIEGFGETVAGAAACLIVTVGTAKQQKQLFNVVQNEMVVRERVVRGLGSAYPNSAKMLAKIFAISTPNERIELLVWMDIRASETMDMSLLMKKLFTLPLSPWEEVLINLTRTKRHWA